MIVIDTHILLWWKLDDPLLRASYRDFLERANDGDIGVSTVSFMEILCLHDRGRISLPEPPERWIERILDDTRIRAIAISTEISIDAFRLPGTFHKDPADRIIVASARVYDCPILTQDGKIIDYIHVKHFRDSL